MCGILSVINKEISDDVFAKALNTLDHRGPDASGVFSDTNAKVTLGHKRLAIIDLSSGQQPLFNEDKSIILVCNGELYDFEKIRDGLISKGHQFMTGSDSEIIIHLYEEYGMDLFTHLRGEFSFILYDKRKQKIFVAKDRFGIKPLYYAVSDKALLVASEMKAIFETQLVSAEIDVEAVRNFIMMVNKGSIFKGVNMVPPGSYISYDLKKSSFSISKYWDLSIQDYDFVKEDISFDEMRGEVLKKFDESVALRLRADVPVGVYLSGGVDSAAILASIAKQKKDKPKAFSISFSDDIKFDESILASKMAKHVGSEYYEVQATKEKLLDNFEDMLWYTEGPTANFHGVGKFLLSKLAREHVKVCLTGEGGDETFLGYDFFKISEDGVPDSFGNMTGKVANSRVQKKMFKKLKKLKNKLGFQPLFEHVEVSEKGLQFMIHSFFSKDHRQQLKKCSYIDGLKEIVSSDEIKNKNPVSQLQHLSVELVLTPYILSMLGDRQEMAHSLEGRTPLLDHHLFEYSRRIPLSYKIKNGNEKYIFKEANKDRIIKDIYERQKWAYFAPPIPFRKGYHSTMDRLIDTYMSKEAIQEANIFDYGTIYRFMHIYTPLVKYSAKMTYKINSMLVYILSVQILYNKYCQQK